MLRGIVVARMLDDPFTHSERKVQPAMGCVALLEVLDDAQRMQIVVEAESVPLKAGVQRALAGVAERRMSNVVDKREGLGQILVQAEFSRDVPRNLRRKARAWTIRSRSRWKAVRKARWGAGKTRSRSESPLPSMTLHARRSPSAIRDHPTGKRSNCSTLSRFGSNPLDRKRRMQ